MHAPDGELGDSVDEVNRALQEIQADYPSIPYFRPVFRDVNVIRIRGTDPKVLKAVIGS